MRGDESREYDKKGEKKAPAGARICGKKIKGIRSRKDSRSKQGKEREEKKKNSQEIMRNKGIFFVCKRCLGM